MTDKQIIKALECCVAKENCEEVSCEICSYEKVYDCKEEILQNALDLINRQKTEIERLKERISYLEESIDCSRKEYNSLLQKLQHARAEAIKEFAERLKSVQTQGFWEENAYVSVDDIDNLVEEMTEEEK